MANRGAERAIVHPISADAKLLLGYALRERSAVEARFNSTLRRCGAMSGVPENTDPSCVVYNEAKEIFTVGPKPRAAGATAKSDDADDIE